MNIVDFIRELQEVASDNPHAKVILYGEEDFSYWEAGKLEKEGNYIIVRPSDKLVSDEELWGEEE